MSANILLSEIPGLEAAVSAAQQRERELRELAFLLDAPHQLGAVEVMAFAPIHFLYLSLAGSPFLGAAAPAGRDEVAQFLWVVSPRFRPGAPARRARFVADLNRRGMLPGRTEALIEEIDEYLDQALMDRRPALRGFVSREQVVCFAANLCDEFGDAYGWPIAVTLRTPFAQLYQLQRCLDRRHAAARGEQADVINRFSAAVKRQIVAEFLAGQKGKAGEGNNA